MRRLSSASPAALSVNLWAGLSAGMLATISVVAPSGLAETTLVPPSRPAAASMAGREAAPAQRQSQRQSQRQFQAQAAAQQLAVRRAEVLDGLRTSQRNLDDASRRVVLLAQRRDVTAAALAARARVLASLIPVALRLAFYPAETLLAAPEPPQDAVRGLIVLNGIGRQIRAEAAAFALEQAELARKQADLDAALPGLRAAQSREQEAVTAAEAALAGAVQSAEAARAQARAASASAAAAARAAEAARMATLDTAVAHLARTSTNAGPRGTHPAPAPDPMPTAVAAGPWRLPVAGQLLRGFGAPTDAGPADGVTLQTAAGARVVCPCTGTVAFAAPFRSYGQLAILDCGGGLHVVLAGLDHLDARPGQALRPGAPVGTMPGRGTPAKPALYVEVRRGDTPVDPSGYLHVAGGSRDTGG